MVFRPRRASALAVVPEKFKLEPTKLVNHQRLVNTTLSALVGGICSVWGTTCFHAAIIVFHIGELLVADGS